MYTSWRWGKAEKDLQKAEWSLEIQSVLLPGSSGSIILRKVPAVGGCGPWVYLIVSGSNLEVTRPPFTLTILQRTKIFQNIALFIFLPRGNYRGMGSWDRPNEFIVKDHCGFFIHLKLISYNHKGKMWWCTVLVLKKITDQRGVFLMPS